MGSTRTSAPATFDPPAPGDPRHAYAVVTEAVGPLIAAVEPDQLDAATPCPEFTVKDLLEHIVLVQRRVAAIGRGEHWSSVTETAVDAGWHDDYVSASREVVRAWADPAKLDAVHEVPWGKLPGVPMIQCYVGEIAVHGWDLARATGQLIALDDAVVQGALDVATVGMPADARTPEMLFGPVVEPGAEAPVLERLAGWFGRDVA